MNNGNLCPKCVAFSLAVTEQPAPKAVEGEPAIWDLIIQDVDRNAIPGSIAALVAVDMRTRDEVKARDHGQRLQAFNGRDALVDAYQEALDTAAYIRQNMREGRGGSNVYDAIIRVIKDLRTMIKARDGR